MSLKDIASKLKLNEKTVRAWKNIGGWESKREMFLKNRSSLHEELYEFSRKLMSSIEEDLEKKEKVDQGRFYTLTRILPLIMKVKAYEDIVVKSEKGKNMGLTKEIIEQIEREVLGIRREEYEIDLE